MGQDSGAATAEPTDSGTGGEADDGSGSAGTSDSDGSVDPPCVDVSGSRLRHVLLEQDNGAREYQRIHDTALDTACAFAVAADGVQRCIPSGSSDVVSLASEYYSDPSCESHIASQPSSVEIQPRFATSPIGECGTATRVMSLGEVLDYSSLTFYRRNAEGSCESVPPLVSTRTYRAATEIPPEEFVSGSIAWSEGSRITRARIEASDGHVSCTDQLRDAAFDDVGCQPVHMADGSLRCGPTAVQYEEFYRSSDCSDDSSDYFASLSACEEGMQFARVYSDCAPAIFYSIGDPIEAYRRDYTNGAACELVTDEATHQIDEVDPAAFAGFEIEWPASGERLDRVELTTQDGLRMPIALWRDNEFDVYCRFRVAPDGTLRCFPRTRREQPQATWGTFFSDQSCTNALELGFRTTVCDLTDVPPPAFAVEPLDYEDHRVFALGEQYQEVVYVRSGGLCEPAPSDYVFYTVLNEMPPASFVAATQRQE